MVNVRKKLTENLGLAASIVTIVSAMAGAIIWMFATFTLQNAFNDFECRSKAQAAFLTNSIIIMQADREISRLTVSETAAEVLVGKENTIENRNTLKEIQTELENKKSSRQSIADNTKLPNSVDCSK